MNLKITELLFSLILICFCACKKETVEPTPSQTTTTTIDSTTTNSTTTTNTGQGGSNMTRITSIVVTPNYGSIVTSIHNSVTYSAKAYNRYGNELTANFIWTIGNDSIGLMDSLGMVEGLGLGATYVQASVGSVQSNRSDFFVIEDCIQLNPPPVSEPAILGAPSDIVLNVGDTYELTDYIESKRCRVPLSAFKCSADISIAGLSMATNGSLNTVITGISRGKTIVTLSFQDRRKYIVVEVI